MMCAKDFAHFLFWGLSPDGESPAAIGCTGGTP